MLARAAQPTQLADALAAWLAGCLPAASPDGCTRSAQMSVTLTAEDLGFRGLVSGHAFPRVQERRVVGEVEQATEPVPCALVGPDSVS